MVVVVALQLGICATHRALGVDGFAPDHSSSES